MIRRSTMVIITIFVILLSLAIYLTRSGKINQAQVKPTQATQTFLPVSMDQVRQIKIEDATGKYVTVERGSDGKWVLVDPQLSPSDTDRIERVLNQFASLSVVTTLEAGLAPEAVGLNPASSTITLFKTDGSLVKVQVGKVTAVGNGYYASVDQQGMQVVNKYQMDQVLNLLSTPPVIVTPTLTFTPTTLVTDTLQVGTPEATTTPAILSTFTATATSQPTQTPAPAMTPTSTKTDDDSSSSTVEKTATKAP